MKYIVTDAAGKARYSTDHYDAGSYNVLVAFFGDDTYSASNRATSKLTINKIATKLTATSVTTSPNSGKYIIATLTDANGNPVSGAKIGFANNGMKYIVTDAAGKARYSTNHFGEGVYNVKVAFFGDDKYQASEKATSKLTISKIATKLTVTSITTPYKSGKYLIATLTDVNGNPVSGAKIGFANNGMKYVVTDANGKARYSTDHYEEGSYNVKVAFFGDDKYQASEKATSKMVITKVATKLTVTSLTTTHGSGKYLIATLKDVNGNPISGAKIGFANNGMKYIVTDAAGKARYSTDHYGVGSYNVLVAFFGDDTYSASDRATSKLVIT